MINGNGSTISPSIGFHQPGVVGCHLELDNRGDFRFKDSSVHRNVCAGNLIAESGFLYSRCHGIEVVIGARNTGYVHFVNNASKPYYFDNMVEISGSVIPYTNSGHDLGVTEKRWRKAYIDKVIGGADWADYLSTNYIGGQQPNPQTYFNNTTGLKVAMTGVYTNGTYWSDTLWINGYHGSDVPSCTALHFPRNGSAEMYISSQETKSTNYGTLYRIWSSRNSNKSDVDWVCKGLSAHARIGTTADIYSSGWIRAGGTNGFYCESYGGGIHMTDSTYVRVYNNKSFYVSGNILATGGITAKTTSDMRLKDRVGQIDYAKKLLSLGLVFDYTYNDIAKSRVGKMVDDKRHIGLSYQAVSKVLPAICGKDDDGYGYINYISPDFISLIAGAVQLNILGLYKVENKTQQLERRIKDLEAEISMLKQRGLGN